MDYLGEVLVTHTFEFTAQAIRVNESPAFGSFVKVSNGNEVVFGVVYQVSTGSIDQNRKPMAFGKHEEDLLKEQPQLLQLLKTDFDSIVVGHKKLDSNDKNEFHGYLPSFPPRLHSFVEACTEEEVIEITEDLRYLEILVRTDVSISEQLISACLRKGYQVRNKCSEFLIRTGKHLLPLLKHDLDRFNTVIRSVR